MNVKTKLLAAAIASIAAAPALAGGYAEPIMEEQVYAPPAPSAYKAVTIEDEATWDGLYVGGNIGYITQGDVEGSGFDLGLHAGYNLDLGSVVVGAEVGYAPLGLELDDNAGDMNGAFTAKARAGYDLGDFLPFATFGMKHASADLGAGDESGIGLTYGVGADYKLGENLVLGGELTRASFSDFGDAGQDFTQTSFGTRISIAF